MPDITVRAPLAWLGPGRLVDGASVSIEGDTIAYAGESRYAPGSEITVLVDGVLLPAAADRHVHIALADPGAVLLGGVTAVRDLGWPPEEIVPHPARYVRLSVGQDAAEFHPRFDPILYSAIPDFFIFNSRLRWTEARHNRVTAGHG